MPHYAPRHLAIKGPGLVLVSTDVHGNWQDFAQLEQRFHQLRASHDAPVHWVILGDVVHGPSPSFRHRFDGLYDFDDASARIVERVIALRHAFPSHVYFVLGNHDYAHIGGPPTSKFHPDEAAWLEAQMTPTQIEAMHTLFLDALLAVSTSCGVLLCHGSPGEGLSSFERLDQVKLPARGEDFGVIRDMLFAYGQRGELIDRVLAQLSQGPGFPHEAPLRTVIHGHDRDEDGYYFDEHNQLCPVIFGAPRVTRRYVVLDLEARYEHVDHFLSLGALRHLYT